MCGRRSQKNGGQETQALGRSRGGFSTKVHILVDALGNPLVIQLTPGQRHDISQAKALLADLASDNVIADRGYDSDAFIAFIQAGGSVAVIPPRDNRTEPRAYDKEQYKERHLVECCINKLKQYRRVFSRFEKLASRYMAFLHFAATLLWLR